MSLTIAILSWGAHKTLTNTLETYRYWGLDRLGDERLIFFQEISDKDREIADKYGYWAIGSPTNIGIAEGYKALVDSATSDLFLFLENDWACLDHTLLPIITGETMLESNEADVVRYRSRSKPGHPLWTLQYNGREYDKPTHLLDCVHWREDPTIFPEIKEVKRNWYQTTAQYANWTNNPTMFRTTFLRENVIHHMGSRDAEVDLQPWWELQDYKVAQGEGLFTHRRIG